MSVRTAALVTMVAAVTAVSGATLSSATSSGAAAPAKAKPAAASTTLRLAPSSAALATCFPHASARVNVDLTTDARGKDRFTIRAHGLAPKTDFTVFLLEQAGAPFGAAEYIGDFTTDRHGRATNRYSLIVEEAFAFNNATHQRTDLNSIGVWFADPASDDECLGAGSPVTGFDGDAEAGVQMLNSGTQLLP